MFFSLVLYVICFNVLNVLICVLILIYIMYLWLFQFENEQSCVRKLTSHYINKNQDEFHCEHPADHVTHIRLLH